MTQEDQTQTQTEEQTMRTMKSNFFQSALATVLSIALTTAAAKAATCPNCQTTSGEYYPANQSTGTPEWMCVWSEQASICDGDGSFLECLKATSHTRMTGSRWAKDQNGNWVDLEINCYSYILECHQEYEICDSGQGG